MAFVEQQFPVNVSYGASGGPMRPTSVVKLRSGYEHRNQPWELSLRKYDASVGIRDEAELYTVLDFWENQSGALHGFRWKDWADYRSGPINVYPTATDANIGTGDTVTRVFQLRKSYGSGANIYYRDILKPVEGTILVAIGGTATTNFGVDTSNGSVIFENAPGSGAVVTAGFEFDIPARFEDDNIDTTIEHFRGGEISNINVAEIRVNPEATSAGDIALLDSYFSGGISAASLPSNIWVP